MKLSKAIKILELNLKEAGKSMPPDVYQALALGIGAIDRIQQLRTGQVFSPSITLPGETKE